ncbi:GNAT family N-acetyltransferase [Flammeovirga sp. SubArs3]|uniref:GNAT family N-acetyltransferase n=1 Tax=Flammeovirga sp. SubArs3 TaxID=2995316 RepID=UPI00248B738E|nr:GNAT family N-acetyltransferase [Flammeovirga sp. SubArs3]
MIQNLSSQHLNTVMVLIQNVISKMRSMGIDQWDEQYPTEKDILSDLESSNAYGYFEDNDLAGYVIFNQDFDIEYNDIQWLNTTNKFLVMHRLSVDPKFQGKGIAKKITAYGEQLATKNGLTSLRFDAFIENPISNKMYEKIGYQKLGEVTFRKGVFNCYEKILP